MLLRVASARRAVTATGIGETAIATTLSSSDLSLKAIEPFALQGSSALCAGRAMLEGQLQC